MPEFPPPLTSRGLTGNQNEGSYCGVKLYGSGHVMAYNYIANFHDGLCHDTYGMPDGYPDVPRDRNPVSNDFYNNDITNMHDQCIEADGVTHNARVVRNRCTNIGLEALSGQPCLGGPCYFIRNIVYHSPHLGGAAAKAMFDEGGAFPPPPRLDRGGGRGEVSIARFGTGSARASSRRTWPACRTAPACIPLPHRRTRGTNHRGRTRGKASVSLRA